MVNIEALIARADQIDSRLGPIPGRDADRIAVQLRKAAEEIALLRSIIADIGAVLDNEERTPEEMLLLERARIAITKAEG